MACTLNVKAEEDHVCDGDCRRIPPRLVQPPDECLPGGVKTTGYLDNAKEKG